MSRSNSYNTKQKEEILNVIKKYTHDFTIKEIYDDLNQKVGLTTIYRYIDKLAKNGIINKNIGKNNVTYYQYLEECSHDNHFYLRCDICGEMEHVDCDCIGDLTNHILKKHKFMLNKEHIIINGTCKKCSKES